MMTLDNAIESALAIAERPPSSPAAGGDPTVRPESPGTATEGGEAAGVEATHAAPEDTRPAGVPGGEQAPAIDSAVNAEPGSANA